MLKLKFLMKNQLQQNQNEIINQTEMKNNLQVSNFINNYKF